MTTIARDYDTPPTFDGIYDVPEAARYLRAGSPWVRNYAVNSSKLIRWVRNGLASPDLRHVRGHELLLEFNDLVSMRVIMALRAEGVSWPEIRKTERWLSETRGVNWPFATELLWTGQGELFAEWADRLVSGSRHGQAALDLLRDYVIPVGGLLFNNETGLAISWEPVAGITLDPMVQFGAPCIKGTRIPTRAIYGMIRAGDLPDRVAASYEITGEELQTAYDWESLLAA